MQHPSSVSSADVHTCHVKDDPPPKTRGTLRRPSNEDDIETVAVFKRNEAPASPSSEIGATLRTRIILKQAPGQTHSQSLTTVEEVESPEGAKDEGGDAAPAAGHAESRNSEADTSNPPNALNAEAIREPSVSHHDARAETTAATAQEQEATSRQRMRSTTSTREALPDLTAQCGDRSQRSQPSLSPNSRAAHSNTSPQLSSRSHTAVAGDGLTVNRFIPTARTAPWNSNMEDTTTSPKEELPRIDTQRKTKFDYLSGGVSLAEAEKLQQRQHRTPTKGLPAAAPGLRAAAHDQNAEGDDARGEATPRARGTSVSSRNASQIAARGGSRSITATASRQTGSLAAPQEALNEFRKSSLELLYSIDFAAASRQLRQWGEADDEEEARDDLHKCVQFLHVVARDHTCLTTEDIHALLLVFTPPGVLLHEAADFLWEECDCRTSLSLSDFTRFGDRLRERLTEFDAFARLDEDAKLQHTYARLFPREPVASHEGEKARRRLVQLATHKGGMADNAKALRVYEIVFLADYHADLWRRGVLTHDEVAGVVAAGNAVAGGDACADLQRFRDGLHAIETSPDFGATEAGTQTTEAVEWGGDQVHAAGAYPDGNDDDPSATPARWSDGVAAAADGTAPFPLPAPRGEEGSDDGHDSSGRHDDRAARRRSSRSRTSEGLSARKNNPSRRKNGSRGRSRTPRKRNEAAAAKTTASSVLASPYADTYGQASSVLTHASHRSTSPQSRPSFNLERQPKASHVKYLGRSVEEDYAERADQDARLIAMLQASYL